MLDKTKNRFSSAGCSRFGVSRKTGYKWLGRFDEGGRQGLRDRSRAPHQCPHRITADAGGRREARPCAILSPWSRPALKAQPTRAQSAGESLGDSWASGWSTSSMRAGPPLASKTYVNWCGHGQDVMATTG